MAADSVSPLQSAAAQSAATYSFPCHRLSLIQTDPTRQPLVLVACGSFSPITYLHLRMFEMAADYVRFSNTEFEVIGGYLSPVSDFYKKAGLAESTHRLHMCEAAVNETNNWLMVDPWEAIQSEYMPTAKVLDHFQHEINKIVPGAKIMLLAGADLIQTMSTPGLWSGEDLDHILGGYGTLIIERTGTDIDDALSNLQKWKDNIYVIQQLIQNDVSSTKIRLLLRREMSVRYLCPAPVIEWIEQHSLYKEDPASSAGGKEKSKSTESPGQASFAINNSGSKS